MNVLGIGQINLDRVSIFREYPEEGSKPRPIKSEDSVGSPVPAALILLARLGADCKLIATVGDDETGKVLEKKLENEHVTLLPRKGKHSKVNYVMVNQQNGSRTILQHTVHEPHITNISPETIQQANLIVFDRHEPQAFAEVMQHKRTDTRVIVDPSTEVSKRTLSMLQAVEYPILPIESLTKIRRHEDMMHNLEKLYELAKKPVIITAGDKGSLIYDGQNIDLIPAKDIKAIDTLGAGDIYRGAFGYGILQKWDLRKTVEFANTVSALQCMKLGNSTAIPTNEEIVEFEKNTKNKEVTLEEIFS